MVLVFVSVLVLVFLYIPPFSLPQSGLEQSYSLRPSALMVKLSEEPVRHQLKAVKYMREKFFALKLGKFHDEQKLDLEHWDEPELSAVPEEVWTEIRMAGFAGKVKNRDLRRIWERRASIRQKVELLELGKAGGVFKKAVRTSGKTRRQCSGEGVRTMVVLEKPPKRTRVEGEQEDEQEGEEGEESGEVEGEQGKQVAVKKGKQSLLKEVFQQVKVEFEKWRLGGLYVDNEDLL